MAAPARTPEAYATLVVDGDRPARQVVADALRAVGHAVNTAADGAEALRGTIAVQSTKGEGTAMTVELPLAPRPIATNTKGSVR